MSEKLKLSEIYSYTSPERVYKRYLALAAAYRKHYGADSLYRVFSAPCAFEICGESTVFESGRVVSACFENDVIAAADAISPRKFVIKSDNIKEFTVYFDESEQTYDSKSEESEVAEVSYTGLTMTAELRMLIRCIIGVFDEAGFNTGGIKAYVNSNIYENAFVPAISTLSAAGVLTAQVTNALYNGGSIPRPRIAQLVNSALLKSGLRPYMNQFAATVFGGYVYTDFKDNQTPIITPVQPKKDLAITLCVADGRSEKVRKKTKWYSDEANCLAFKAATEEARESTCEVVKFFEAKSLRHITDSDVFYNLETLRERYGDAAVMRVLFYLGEMSRAEKLRWAIQTGDTAMFVSVLGASGSGQFRYLQSTLFSVCSQSPDGSDEIPCEYEPVRVALCVAELAMSRMKDGGALRTHIGDERLTTQIFVPQQGLKEFKMQLENVLGRGTCAVFHSRGVPACEVDFCAEELQTGLTTLLNTNRA